MKITDLRFENSFLVLPIHANHMYPLIFGGAFMSQLDLTAATIVTEAVKYSTTVNNAVTHKADFEFIAPSYVGDLITMQAKITGVGKKSISVQVEAYRTSRDSFDKIKVAVANFVFVTRMDDEYKYHNLIGQYDNEN